MKPLLLHSDAAAILAAVTYGAVIVAELGLVVRTARARLRATQPGGPPPGGGGRPAPAGGGSRAAPTARGPPGWSHASGSRGGETRAGGVVVGPAGAEPQAGDLPVSAVRRTAPRAERAHAHRTRGGCLAAATRAHPVRARRAAGRPPSP